MEGLNEEVKMSYDARAIANLLLDIADERSHPITHLALQKILYFCHAAHLVTGLGPLTDEPVEAWGHGPVFKSVYRSFKSAGKNPINFRAMKMDFSAGKEECAVACLPDPSNKLIQNIFDLCSRFSASDLRGLSHKADGPWDKVWRASKESAVPGMRISNESIKQFYTDDVSWIELSHKRELIGRKILMDVFDIDANASNITEH